MGDYKFVMSYEKRRLNSFWRTFPKGISIDDWLEMIQDEANIWSNFDYVKATEILRNALKKLHIEKLITENELYNMLEMLDSPDSENKYIVLCVMQKVKKTKFKKK
jgi:hypothetical protein